MTIPFDPTLAAFRFGVGLGPSAPGPASVQAMIASLSGPDHAADRYPIAGMNETDPSMAEFRFAAAARRAARGTPEEEELRQKEGAFRQAMNVTRRNDHLRTIARAVTTDDGLRERLTLFWADHFAVRAKTFAFRSMITPYVTDAIRPHVVGRFPDMVLAATLHPVMLHYLDQWVSTGPNSTVGQRRGFGLNENLARELLELHLFGADGPFTQRDVTELAELLTGVTYDFRQGFAYRTDRAEPGAEVVMGRRYSAEADLQTVKSALIDLATRPEVAEHIASKLVVHFVSDLPEPALVATLAGVFRETGGDLLAVTEAMLSHPAAWTPRRSKVRRPDLFVMASLRALGVDGDGILNMRPADYRDWMLRPLQVMGQPYQAPSGPDGWPEDAESWITPQGLAGRINWAMGAPRVMLDPLPDPRDFVQTALGPDAPAEVTFAASSAETRSEGIGLVLTSPAFQRI
ncbi:DUF1800 family protein [Loktanella sp. 3ANDIMAR09]|uniref:DUF1800 domain-containing protein n=1 Tax=Loktanella sp. 3ANDIMAR09 TaxID=1225657 RepID=UPI000701CA13|nr:DUF1800 domain-containing protein [Loktanella sp. 3ANDIMAR09]